jgi:hypothetical protein
MNFVSLLFNVTELPPVLENKINYWGNRKLGFTWKKYMGSQKVLITTVTYSGTVVSYLRVLRIMGNMDDQ